MARQPLIGRMNTKLFNLQASIIEGGIMSGSKINFNRKIRFQGAAGGSLLKSNNTVIYIKSTVSDSKCNRNVFSSAFCLTKSEIQSGGKHAITKGSYDTCSKIGRSAL